MKHRDLTRRLNELGWWQVPNSGPHEKWTNGTDSKAVPRHREINEFTARGILRFAQQNPPGEEEIMRLKGRIWKDGKYWVVHVPALDLSTQGTSARSALEMICDAVRVESDGLRADATAGPGKGEFTLGAADSDALIAFMLKRLRTSRGLTLREMARRLRSKSPAAYAQYERGRRSPSVTKLEELVRAVDPRMRPVLEV